MIVLDTHVLVWLASAPERLSSRAEQLIASEDERAICTITVQEIAYLVARGRIALDRPVSRWIADAMTAHEVRALAPGVSTALLAGSLPGDPADRLIYATAVEKRTQLVSADERLSELDPGRVVW